MTGPLGGAPLLGSTCPAVACCNKGARIERSSSSSGDFPSGVLSRSTAFPIYRDLCNAVNSLGSCCSPSPSNTPCKFSISDGIARLLWREGADGRGRDGVPLEDLNPLPRNQQDLHQD